jgi:hypothetical protein
MPGVRQALLQDLDGRADAGLTPDDLAWLDAAAALTEDADGRLAELRRFYAGSSRGRSVLARLDLAAHARVPAP